MCSIMMRIVIMIKIRNIVKWANLLMKYLVPDVVKLAKLLNLRTSPRQRRLL